MLPRRLDELLRDIYNLALYWALYTRKYLFSKMLNHFYITLLWCTSWLNLGVQPGEGGGRGE